MFCYINPTRSFFNMPRIAKKRAPSKYPRRAPYAKKRAYGGSTMRTPSDGMTILSSSYIEVDGTQAALATAKGGVIGYIIKCDPKQMTLQYAGVPSPGGSFDVTSLNADNVPVASGQPIQMARFDQFATLYRQYRINSVTVKITTGRNLGLDNCLTCLTDRQKPDPILSVGAAMSQAHKSQCLTEPNRTMVYDWKPSSAAEREFQTLNQGIIPTTQTLSKFYRKWKVQRAVFPSTVSKFHAVLLSKIQRARVRKTRGSNDCRTNVLRRTRSCALGGYGRKGQ